MAGRWVCWVCAAALICACGSSGESGSSDADGGRAGSSSGGASGDSGLPNDPSSGGTGGAHIASRPVVVHNTLISGSGASGFFSSIDYRFGETDAYIANNLTRRITQRDGASATLESNLEDTPLDVLVDAAGLDFHLAAGASSAIDRGTPVDDSGLDIDGEPHAPAAPDIGADERSD